MERRAKRIVPFLLFILLGPFAACAQKTTLHFAITDKVTNEPVALCFVVVQGKKTSAQSDEKGEVELKALPEDTLVIFQVGYFLQKKTVTQILANGNKIQLVPKSRVLNEVVVKADRTDTLQNNNPFFFLDFDFYDDLILALINKGKKYNTLYLLDLNGDKITEKQLNIKAESLFRDCFGNIHLLAKDSIYQVYYNYQSLSLLKPYPISSYYHFLKPCECYSGTNYVFKVKHYRSLKNSYYLYNDQQNRKKELLICVADSDAIAGFNMDYDINYFLEQRRKGLGYRTSVAEINKNIDKYREELVLPGEYNNLLRPVESEMATTDTAFILFDYTNKCSYTFTPDGKPLGKNALTGFSAVTPKLYVDYDTRGLIFSSMSNSGVLTLYRYDPETNTFTHSFELKNFYYISRFKIKENNLYFIHKDKSAEITRTKIIKRSISWKKL
jgi:hypothetical protein